MHGAGVASDDGNWRRSGNARTAAQSIPSKTSQLDTSSRFERDQDNWRVHSPSNAIVDKSPIPSSFCEEAPISSSSLNNGHTLFSNHQRNKSHQPSSNKSQFSSSVNNKNNNDVSLLSSSLKTAQGVGMTNYQASQSTLSVKPSSMGNGVIARSSDLATSPSAGKGFGSLSSRSQWPLSSSLEKSSPLAPATSLQPLRIDHVGTSRFFPTHSTPSRQIPSEQERNNNWMLTPTSSLPSIPNTPGRRREHSTDTSTSSDNPVKSTVDAFGFSSRPPLATKLEQPQGGLQSASRTSSPAFNAARQDGAHGATSAFLRHPAVNLHSSPKRSPLVPPTVIPPTLVANRAPSAHHRSPGASPMVPQRTLSPSSRQAPFLTDSQDRITNTISSMLTGSTAFPRPGSTSRRESFHSMASSVSAAPGHSLSHSRRSSAVLSPHSPSPSGRIGVYRPPHLRNRGSFSGLKPSVAHYDRVRTPSLRGLSRSRESSISLSRPPSTIPFHTVSDAILEDGQVADDDRSSIRGRQASASIHLPDLIAEQQQRTALATGDGLSDSDAPLLIERRSEVPQDSALLLANMRAQLVRREAAATETIASDPDRPGTILENEENDHDFFNISDMIEYGVADGYPISRHSSMYPGSERPLKEVFEIGDLLGPGIEHDGHLINIAETTPGFVDQNADLSGSKLEVIRKLGEGSYAVVYLVKEVEVDTVSATPAEKLLSDEQLFDQSSMLEGSEADADRTMVGPSEDLLSSTLKAKLGNDDGFHSSPALERRRRKDLRVKTHLQPGREFALKCLCKRDLPEDMLEVQRLEATIHQSIPAHPNIVTLYRTYETQDWLFLVLEYCPGQDLYYWLEQAQDSGSAVDHHKGADFDKDDSLPDVISAPGNKMDNESKLDAATPPSPSILASTSGNMLLSKRRIRLVARMFRQICDAVQFCHERGISHRDIKPENFIVEDRRTIDQMLSATADMSSSTLIGSSRDGDDMQVIVKMTDFGLATATDQCDDFDCGSKPYMAFECHNNVSSSYDPKQADIWSLGIVLLNMLFHRSPFTEPSSACPSFTAYCHDPINFLMESFDGLSETVAQFLHDNVFCAISPEHNDFQQRISAGEFSRWASKLAEHMGLSRSGSDRISRGGSIYSTMPLVHSRNASMSTLPSMMNSPSSRSRSMTLDSGNRFDGDINPDSTYRGSHLVGFSPTYPLFTPDVLPSPTFTPLPTTGERNPFEHQYNSSALGWAPQVQQEAEKKDACKRDATMSLMAKDPGASKQIAPNGPAVVTAGQSDLKSDVENLSAIVSVSDSIDNGDVVNVDEDEDTDPVTGDTQAGEGDSEKPESITTSNHSKRRKRGARKGRTLAKQLKRSQSVENLGDLNSHDPAARAKERERTIRELASASQTLARQMSRVTKPQDGSDELSSEPVVLSKPTAEAAARYSLQSLAQTTDGVRGDSLDPDVAGRVAGAPENSSQAMANWTSAAQRRDRMSEHRKMGAGPVLEDSGRGHAMSWRDRNQSNASVSSFASSINTVSSQSSATSATSSIFSTTSAPAALTRKDYSRRNGTRSSGFGLDTISERERTNAKREVDAQYLAGIFGGGADAKGQDKKKREASKSTLQPRSIDVGSVSIDAGLPSSPIAGSNGDRSERGKLFSLLSETKDKSSSTTLLSTQSANSASQDQRSSALTTSGARAVSASSVGSNSSGTGVGSTFVSRFRRPGSSSSTKSPALQGMDALQLTSSSSTTCSTTAAKSTGEDLSEAFAATGLHNGEISTNDAPAATTKKQRGMGKFLLGMRDSMKNF